MIQNNDDLQLHGYQDDVDARDDQTDPLMDEREDDPVKVFGIPAKEFKKEMDKLDLERPDSDDEREEVEDLDEDPESRSLAA
jgi:hypothetical protein